MSIRPASASQTRAGQVLMAYLQPLASLRFTVVLLALSMVLIFAGTTVQSELSIWDVQKRYFHTWFTFIEWRLFFPLWEWGNKNIPGAIPFPGGYTLISLLLINLIAAHALRFKLSFKRSGILLIHSGLILLLVGELITSVYQVEGQMVLDVGGSSNFTSDIRQVELAVIDPSPADHDQVTVIPGARLMHKGTIQHPSLPFAIHVEEFYPNSDVVGPMQPGAAQARRPTAGVGRQIGIVPRPKATGTQAQQVDQPSAFVTLISNDGQNLGTYLVSTLTLLPQFPQIHEPQPVRVGDRQYWIQLRFKREYRPYTIHLKKFTHDRYTGTDIPKNFASLVRLVDERNNVDREVLIWMNHPLRYAGETFYQASFKPGDQTSILLVVRNPGWLLPYISCTMVGVGMLVHFGMHLMQFLGRVRNAAPGGQKNRHPSARGKDRPTWIPAAIVSGICILYLLSLVRSPAQPPGSFDLNLFGRLPVSFDGRTMPLDSLARNSLRIVSGRDTLSTEQGKRPAINWLLDVFARPDRAVEYKVFRIDHPDIKSLLGLSDDEKRFSIGQITPKLDKLQEQFTLASGVERNRRDAYQRQIVELAEHIILFNRLRALDSLLLSPPLVSDQWRSFGEAIRAVRHDNLRDPGSESIQAMLEAYHNGMPEQFNAVANAYWDLIRQRMPTQAQKLGVEVLFNRASPFTSGMALYVVVFLLAMGSWLKWHGPLARAALWTLVVALVFHTLGLIARIYLQGRPPVTNLYSSAIFIAWAAVAFCVALEVLYRNAVPSAAAAVVAFPSLLIAHYLAGDGDTMRMLQAVLDTNFWLATHVVVITLGYTAAFLAATLAAVYIVGGVFTRALHADARNTLTRMVYGVVCFAMLFSFVGTILGGIWADQSWGRFWGWDPKENGAILIVLWIAIILHARWGGLVRQRGLMCLSVVAGIVTSWSWFGTNMLGVGLHSYGFMDSAVTWLALYVFSQIAIILVGNLPINIWRSYSSEMATAQAPAT
ncbi:cytochrome c biogenesis protein CcsA [Fontivita pretiosa]|uniref:cytochrome c biogenesis protein n=1 Tax=Fontivita pretiosa TaxID=2989684 RepID=UPI003D16EA35